MNVVRNGFVWLDYSLPFAFATQLPVPGNAVLNMFAYK